MSICGDDVTQMRPNKYTFLGPPHPLAGEQIDTFHTYSKYTKENKINHQSLPYKGWYLAHVALVHALKPCRSYIH